MTLFIFCRFVDLCYPKIVDYLIRRRIAAYQSYRCLGIIRPEDNIVESIFGDLIWMRVTQRNPQVNNWTIIISNLKRFLKLCDIIFLLNRVGDRINGYERSEKSQ